MKTALRWLFALTAVTLACWFWFQRGHAEDAWSNGYWTGWADGRQEMARHL